MTVQRLLRAAILVLAFICHTTQHFAAKAADGLLGEVPFKPSFHGIAFTAGKINGKDIDLLVDTGGASMLVDDHVADELGLKLQRAQASVSGNSSVTVGFAPDTRVTVGPVDFRGTVVTAPLAPMEPIFGRTLKAIADGDLFRACIVQFDYEQQQIRFFSAHTPAAKSWGEALPITITEGIPFVELEVSMPNGKALTGKFLIDTGAGNAAVQVYRDVAERAGLVSGLKTVSDAGRGIGGETPEVSVRAAKLRLGKNVMTRPVVALTDDTSGPKTKEISVGLVGIEVLRRFQLTFDYQNSKMYAQPYGSLSDPFVYDASGLRLRADPPSFAKIYVGKVISGSAAEKAGVQPRDILLAIDDHSISGMNLEQVRAQVYKPGVSHRLRLSRGQRELEVELKTCDRLE